MSAAGIGKLLVANRGEIAVRVFRTCRDAGIGTVAVAEPGRRGLAPRAERRRGRDVASYLDAAEHVRAARETGADAVHPGYGFLAESAELAEAVEAAGLTWIGPPPVGAPRRAATSSRRSRSPATAGVPVVETGDAERDRLPAARQGGGGGRRARHARRPARSRARARARGGPPRGRSRPSATTPSSASGGSRARGTSRCSCSPTRTAPCAALGERECSMQRRHQKVLEESPSPGIDDRRPRRASSTPRRASPARSATGAPARPSSSSARTALLLPRAERAHPGRAPGHRGRHRAATSSPTRSGSRRAGTSSRASGARGHAIEVRLYAEDPLTFLPQAGKVERLRLPAAHPGRRRRRGGRRDRHPLRPADREAHRARVDRDEAIDRLAEALAETDVGGLVTNLPFLRWLVAHPSFRAGDTTTDFLTRFPPLTPAPARVAAAAVAPSVPAQPARAPGRAAAARRARARPRAGEASDEVTAPMPGTVIRVLVARARGRGARHPRRVEAMKMEMPFQAPRAGSCWPSREPRARPVARGEVLVELDGGR